MGFVDDKEAWRGVWRRARAWTRRTQGFVRYNGRTDTELLKQGAPLRNEYRGEDEGGRLVSCERDGEGHVGLAQSHGIGEERAAVAREDGAQPFGRGELVWCEPRRPRL